MSFRAASCTIAVAVLLLAVNVCCVAAADPPKPVAHKLTVAAIPCTKVTADVNACEKPTTFKKVPYFPGTKFVNGPCGGHGEGDSTITVSATELTFLNYNSYGHPNTITITYRFADATLLLQTYPKTPAESATSVQWSLSDLLDGPGSIAKGNSTSADNVGAYYANLYRPIATQTLGSLVTYLTPFAKQRPAEAWCEAKPYSPQVGVLVAYLKQVQGILRAYKPRFSG